MMDNKTQLKLQAYLDRELATAECKQMADLIARDGGARALYQELQQTKELVAGNELEIKHPEHWEFFWSKLEREIGRESATVEEPNEEKATLGGWWLRYVAPLAGLAAMIVLSLSLIKEESPSTARAENFHQIEAPLAESASISFYSQEAGMTVVWIASGN